MSKKSEKSQRTYSTAFKKEKVLLLESGKVSVLELSKIYEVSCTAIYKWKRKYGKDIPGERLVIEKISEGQKNVELLKKIAELEQIIGKQQVSLLHMESIIECGSELLGEDLSKKYNSQPSKKA